MDQHSIEQAAKREEHMQDVTPGIWSMLFSKGEFLVSCSLAFKGFPLTKSGHPVIQDNFLCLKKTD